MERDLLGSVELDTASLQSLACVLLLHYRTTSQCIPGHRLHSRMKEECLRMCSIRVYSFFYGTVTLILSVIFSTEEFVYSLFFDD